MGPLTNQINLDLENPNVEKFHHWKETVFGLVNKIYAPKDGYRLSRVQFGERLLWRSENSFCTKVTTSYHKKRPVLIHINVLNKGTKESLYYKEGEEHIDHFYKVGILQSPKWELVKEEEFYLKFNRFAEHNHILKDLYLPLNSNVNPRRIFANKSPELIVDLYVPNVGFRLKAVKDGFREVWKAKSLDERIATVFAFPRTGYTNLHLVVEDLSRDYPLKTDLFFKKTLLFWRQVSKEDYLEDLKLELERGGVKMEQEKLEEDLYYYYHKDISLKLNAIDENHFYICKNYVDKLSNVSVIPKPGFLLKEVIVDTFVINCVQTEIVLYSNLHYYGDSLFSLYLVVSSIGKDKVMYLIKKGSEWSVSNFTEYISRFSHCSYYKESVERSSSMVSTKSTSRSNSATSNKFLSRSSSFTILPLPTKKENRVKTTRIVGINDLYKKINNLEDDSFQGKIFTSSFRNRSNLLIRTYFSPAENYSNPKKVHKSPETQFASKKNALMVCGIASSFLEQYMSINISKFLERINFANLNPHTYYTITKEDEVMKKEYFELCYNKYSEIFNSSTYYSDNLLDVFKSFCYSGSLTELLNKMGYNVYSYDLQSNGLSEGPDDLKCYNAKFEDNVHDLLQYISIIKNNEFFDNNQSYDFDKLVGKEKKVTKAKTNKPEEKEEFVLIGYSMGANVSLQAIELYSLYNKGMDPLVDTFISVSGMYNVVDLLNPISRKTFPFLSKLVSSIIPQDNRTLMSFKNYGTTMRRYKFFNDPYYYIFNYRQLTCSQLFEACENLSNILLNYPSNIKTLVLHSNKDPTCHINGSNKFYESIQGTSSQYIQFNSNFHAVLNYEFIGFIEDIFKKTLWT